MASFQLASFFVTGVATTPLTILGEFQALFGIGLVFGRHVVAAFTRFAGQRDGRTFVRGHALDSFGFAEPGREVVPPGSCDLLNYRAT